MYGFNTFDIIFAVIILLSAILALIRGGLAEILSLSSWFIAIFVMKHYGNIIDHYIPNNITQPLIRTIIIYAISFIATAIVITIVQKLLNIFISSIGLGSLNYFLGVLFGIVRGIIICSLIITLIEMFNLDSQHTWKQSRFAPLLKPAVLLIANAIPNQIKHLNQLAH